MIARRFTVRGHVQGVGFRYFAVRAARSCGVTGTVRNLSDGSVEAIAEGSAAAVACFRDQLARGPSYGFVDAIDESEMIPSGRHRSFEVAY